MRTTHRHESSTLSRITVTQITLSEFEACWRACAQAWQSCPFVTPAWLTAWWGCFGQHHEPLLLQIDPGDGHPGIAPLMVTRDGAEARFMGSLDLCDYGEFLLPNAAHQVVFFRALLQHLKAAGVRRLVLERVRPGSSTLDVLAPLAGAEGHQLSIEPCGVSSQMSLPETWEEYLASLSRKQRHEARRKLRRVAEAGGQATDAIHSAAQRHDAVDAFLTLFRRSREDKAQFMTPEREAFFRTLCDALDRAGMLDMRCVSLDHRPVAMTLCIRLGQTTYLYNNGFDPQHPHLSLGTVSKLLTIRSSINTGQQVYDFLNGTERYKQQLGGHEVSLSSCTVHL